MGGEKQESGEIARSKRAPFPSSLPPSIPPSLPTYRQINTGALSLSGAILVPFTKPPAASTRCFSLSSSGLWSKERGRACRERGAQSSSSRLGAKEGEGGREGGKRMISDLSMLFPVLHCCSSTRNAKSFSPPPPPSSPSSLRTSPPSSPAAPRGYPLDWHKPRGRASPGR